MVSEATFIVSGDADLQCVDLKTCPLLFNLFKIRPMSDEHVKLLKSSHCGFNANKDPKVWCPVITTSCTTPNGQKSKWNYFKRNFKFAYNLWVTYIELTEILLVQFVAFSSINRAVYLKIIVI